MWDAALTLSVLCIAAGPAVAQQDTGRVTVQVRSGAAPVARAEVRSGAVLKYTDAHGDAVLALPAGSWPITARLLGFAPETVQVVVRGGADTSVTVPLREQPIETQAIVATASRSGRVIRDQATRIEALPQEEIEENLTTAPGSLTTLLGELGGVHVQTTSPTLGAASLRLQGLKGRYTQVLADGLPLLGGHPDELGLLQVPPLDLAQVEVLKGTASALYGGSALGGVLNLVSRRPGGEPELLMSQALPGSTDAVGFVPRRLSRRWGLTLLGGAHAQRRYDANGDGWSDLPSYRRGEVRPRLFWQDAHGSSLLATVGLTAENRLGGTLPGAAAPDGRAFLDSVATRRADAGIVGRFLLARGRLLSVRASATGSRHARVFGDERDRESTGTAFGEATLGGTASGHAWVFGTALQHDAFHSRTRPDVDFGYTVPALFAQDEFAPAEWLTVAANARADFHSEFGAFFMPRVSALVRPAGAWSIRLSAATGYSAPTPLVEETEVIGVTRLVPLSGVRAERARSASADVGWTAGRFQVNGTLFASSVRGALQLREGSAPESLEIVNAATPTRTWGSELLARYVAGPLHVIATHTFTHSTEADPEGDGRRTVPLTPTHAAELGALWEDEERGRFGVEVSYTGLQHLAENPFRTTSVPYVELNLLGELRLAGASLFVNALNLTNVRQTRYDPLVRPTRDFEGRWTTDAWAPLVGRRVDIGVRAEIG